MEYIRSGQNVAIILDSVDLKHNNLKMTYKNVLFSLQRFENVILDMRKIRFLDSTVLSLFLLLHQKSCEHGSCLSMRNLRKRIMEILYIHKIDKCIPCLTSLPAPDYPYGYNNLFLP